MNGGPGRQPTTRLPPTRRLMSPWRRTRRAADPPSRPILDEDSYARLRRLYTVAEIRALVLTGQGDEETALRELARLEEVYQKRRG